MKKSALAILVTALLAPLAFAWQVDTNTTTTTTLYTPAKPSDILIGKVGTTNAVWIAVSQSTNDWLRITN